MSLKLFSMLQNPKVFLLELVFALIAAKITTSSIIASRNTTFLLI
jgi:hypothetical protein